MKMASKGRLSEQSIAPDSRKNKVKNRASDNISNSTKLTDKTRAFHPTSFWILIIRYLGHEEPPTFKHHAKEDSKRGNWSTLLDYYTSLIGCMMGIDNMWRLPNMIHRHGEGTYLLVYLIVNVFVGIPMVYLELCVGQFCSKGPIEFLSVAPLFKGLGFCMVLTTFIFMIEYAQVITYGLYCMQASLHDPLPWKDCDHGRSQGCADSSSYECNEEIYVRFQNGTCYSNTSGYMGVWNTTAFKIYTGIAPVFPEAQYFTSVVIKMNDMTKNTMYDVIPHLVLCWAILWFFSSLFFAKGMLANSKYLVIPVVFPCFFLLFLLIRSLTKINKEAAEHLFKPDFLQFFQPKIWQYAIRHILASMSITSGILITLASHCRFNDNITKPALIMVISDVISSLTAGLIVITFLDTVEEPFRSSLHGFELSLLTYMRSVNGAKAGRLISFSFCAAGVMMGFTTLLALVHVIVIAILDQWPKLLKRQGLVGVVICTCCFLLGMPVITREGFLLGRLLANNVYSVSGFSMSLCFLVIFIIVYGWDRLKQDIALMTQKETPPILGYMLKLFVALFIALTIYGFYHSATIPNALSKHYPHLPLSRGWTFLRFWVLLGPVTCIPIGAIIQLFRRPPQETLLQRLRALLTPEETWGPALVRHRMMVHYVPGFVVNPWGKNDRQSGLGPHSVTTLDQNGLVAEDKPEPTELTQSTDVTKEATFPNLPSGQTDSKNLMEESAKTKGAADA